MHVGSKGMAADRSSSFRRPDLRGPISAILIAASASNAAAQAATLEKQEIVRQEAFAVTGSLLRRTEGERIQPVTTVTARDFSSGAIATPLELMQRVPALGALSAYEGQDGGRVRGSASSLNLRGLGGQNTLILLNGHRLPYYSLPLSGLVFVNLNNLPLAAVDRVEVLRDGASAIYGADATAGVVNFITKRSAEERRIMVRVGDTTDGAAPERRGTLTLAQRFPDGNGSFLLVADFYHRDALMARNRTFATLGDLRERVPAPFGAANNWNLLSNIGPYASFTLVNQAGLPNTLPGTTTNAAYVEFDRTLKPGTRAVSNYYNDAAFFSLVPSRDSRDVYLSVDRKLTRQITVHAEASHNRVGSDVAQSPMTISSTQNIDASGTPMSIPASNYYNPFGTRFFGPGTGNPTVAPRAVQFNYVEPAFGSRLGRITTSQEWLLTGLSGGFGSAWSWETVGVYAANRARDLTRNLLRRSALVSALVRTTPDAFNMFAGPDANNESVLSAIRTDSYTGGRSGLASWASKVKGALLQVPAGAVQTAAGIEYRDERLRSANDDAYRSGDLVNTAVQTDFAADRDIRSAHAEFAVPLLHDDTRDLFRRGELQLAGRWESFSNFGSSAKPRAGLSLQPLPGLMLRASIGQGFRAPSLAQLYGGVASSMAARIDPFRAQDGNIRRTIYQPPSRTLRPEQTESRSVGVVWEPSFLRGLSLQADVWHYGLRDQINVISRDAELALEQARGAYSNPYVVRVPPTSTVPIGPIISISEPLANFSRAETSGADFAAACRFGRRDTGQWRIEAEGTYLRTYRTQLDASRAFVNFPSDLSRPRFRSTGRVEFVRRQWTVTTGANFTSRYNPADRVTVAGRDYIMPSYLTWNLAGSYRWTWASGKHPLTLSAGVNNVADRPPPLYPTRQGYDARLFSPQGRFAYLSAALEL